MIKTLCTLLCVFLSIQAFSQIRINEGSNKNYTTIADEEGEFNDWIEIHNAGANSVDLYNYTLTDTTSQPTQWAFPHYNLAAGAFEVIFCSGKNLFKSPPFTATLTTGSFTATNSWNTHNFTTPFNWDGTSNVVINLCSYSSTGYTSNSSFNQSATTFNSCIFAYQDGSPASCSSSIGTAVMQRPNIQLNGVTIGNGTITNGNINYPAPYGNWFWGARHQLLILASELTAAGLSAGPINSLAFDVVQASGAVYDYIDISMINTNIAGFSNSFLPLSGRQFHTNFKIGSAGETISLYNPAITLENSLLVNCSNYDDSKGSLLNATNNITYFQPPTPGATNNFSFANNGYAKKPSFSVVSGVYSSSFGVLINHTNGTGSSVYYTTDGSEPTTSSTLYTGSPILVSQTTPMRARVYVPGKLPSLIAGATYLFNIQHVTPIISVITDNANLYGPTGNFDNPTQDWLKAAYVEYFDSTPAHSLVFSQASGMIQDGGAGGSRTQPQHSFRLELANSVVGAQAIKYKVIPTRPNRTTYSNFYLRNGSNQFLNLPYKDASQVQMMAGQSNTYYSGWRPVSVYINGGYFGLYELREKFDQEYFNTYDGASKSSTEILSLSYFYNSILRSVTGSVDSFWSTYNRFTALNTNDTLYWDKADPYFDMKYYTDYIIGQSWMGNTDWPQNNIKIYRSNKTSERYRFCIIDQELSMNPYAWSDCTFDHISYMLSRSTSIPYINIFLQSLQNDRFHNYFINRFADLMNTSFDTMRLKSINSYMYNQTVTEMANEYTRWGGPNVPVQLAQFASDSHTFERELVCRTAQVRNHITTNFNLPKQVDITLDVYPAGAGKIHISTITPTTYPWTGVYFDGVPVKIEALANAGYYFSHWGNNTQLIDTLKTTFLDTLNSALTFKAYFLALPNFLPTVSDMDANFSVYPSPAEDQITLLTQNLAVVPDAQYEIENSSGQLMQKGDLAKFTQTTSISIANFPKGIYFISIKNKHSYSKHLKFVKM